MTESTVQHLDKTDRYGEQRDVMLEFVLKHLEIKDNTSLLDAGCGLGVFLEAIKNPTVKKTGVDIDPECIEISRTFLPNADLRVADVCDLPFPDNSFDLMTATCLLEHVDNPTAMIKEMHRVCREGGAAMISTPNIGRPLRLMLAAQKKRKYDYPGHCAGWDYHLLIHLLESNGWTVEKIETRFVDCPFYAQLPRFIGNFMSHRLLPRLFPWVGSELYAFCRK